MKVLPIITGHGTHIAGMIAGNGSNSYEPEYLEDIHGVAPGVHLISLKVLNKNGAADDAAVIRAIDRAIQLKDVYNIKVINLSAGTGDLRELQDGSALSGSGKGVASRNHTRGRGRQRRPRQFGERKRVWRDRGAGQRSARHYSGRDEHGLEDRRSRVA
jgi:hypothetical protein